MCNYNISNIPNGVFCYDNDKQCPYWKNLGKIKYNCLPTENELLCDVMTIFDFKDNNCEIDDNMRCKGCECYVTKCDYLNLVDYDESTLLWDQIKECDKNLEEFTTKKTNVNNIELGNLLFGHSYGEFEIPRRDWEDLFCEFLTRNGFDTYGRIDNNNLEKYSKIKYSNNTRILQNGDEYLPHIHYFENDIFSLNPYYWGDEEDLQDFPNFVYKPLNLEIRWYKWPFRSAFCNKMITLNDFKDILQHINDSLIIETE